MQFVETTATKKVFSLNKRIQGISGGTSASKTISILLRLIAMAQTDTTSKMTSVVSENYPHMKKGAMRDFLNIMQGHGYFEESRWNRTDSIYTFPATKENPSNVGSQIEFFGADMPSKAHGPRRDRLFINEGNNIKWDTADHMIVRTRELVIVDWNPTHSFWFYEEIIPHRIHDFLTVTYLDNEALEQEIVDDIEAHKHNKNWWKVYGEGQLGEPEDMVFKNWIPIDDVPHEARLISRGLDFGYTNHPSALVAVYYWNGSYILNEEMYRKGMQNEDIHDKIMLLPEPQKLVIADSAEPKSIDALAMLGTNVIGANKGPGSVSEGIDFIQSQRIYYTKRSTSLAKEYRNYMFMRDKDGNLTNEPEDLFNHAMDAVRYALELEHPTRQKQEPVNTGNASALIY